MKGQLDRQGKKKYSCFKKACEEIYADYKKYGVSVLDYELEGEDENLRNVFKEDAREFQEKLLEYWTSKYQMVLKSFKDFEKIPKENRHDKIYLGKHDGSISIARNLFKHIINSKSLRNPNVPILANGKLYIVEAYESFSSYICIKEIYTNEEIIKD